MSEQSSCCGYSTRPAAALGVISLHGWAIKPHRILGRPSVADAPLDSETLEVLRRQLPASATGPARPGVGFVIEHLASPLDYLVLCWWDNSNEMITRINVREGGRPWRESRGTESFCVWDLDIMWHERNAFVRTMLKPASPDAKAYLSDRFTKPAAG